MFDELDKSAGLIGSVEYGIDEYLMNEEGDLWKRDEPDPTLRRYPLLRAGLLAPTVSHAPLSWVGKAAKQYMCVQ